MPRVSLAACFPVLVLLALAPPFAAAGGTDGSHHDACGCVASCVQQCSHTPTADETRKFAKSIIQSLTVDRLD